MPAKENTDIDPKFREWACSFSGCDGGDPGAPIWVCGIEWGYGKRRGQSDEAYEALLKNYYSSELPEEIRRGKAKHNDRYDWEEHNNCSFNQSVAKLYLAIHGQPVEEYCRIHKILENPLLFKLNLYPIPFRYADDSQWRKYGIDDLTGMQSKEAYRTWCFLNRFPEISKVVPKHNPKLIIGAGITYLVDFFACFAGTQGSGNINVEEVDPKGSNGKSSRRFYWSIINDGHTLLAVVPFFSGQYGLNSNALLQLVGKRIEELRQKYVVPAASASEELASHERD